MKSYTVILCFLSYFSFLLARQIEPSVKRYISLSGLQRALGRYLRFYMTFMCVIIAVLSKVNQGLVSVFLFTLSFCDTLASTIYIVYISFADSVSYSFTRRTYFVILTFRCSIIALHFIQYNEQPYSRFPLLSMHLRLILLSVSISMYVFRNTYIHFVFSLSTKYTYQIPLHSIVLKSLHIIY